jgi:hypothetical protein
MERIRQPRTPTKLIPIMRKDGTKQLLSACKGSRFVNLRDEALLLADVDLNTESVHLRAQDKHTGANGTPAPNVAESTAAHALIAC